MTPRRPMGNKEYVCVNAPPPLGALLFVAWESYKTLATRDTEKHHQKQVLRGIHES
jgi:hypothetical protein